jgi:hypothetical protein
MNKFERQYEEAVIALAQQDLVTALQLATGTFVSLLVAVMKRHGHDANKEIKVDGGANRDITVHAAKPRATTQEAV